MRTQTNAWSIHPTYILHLHFKEKRGVENHVDFKLEVNKKTQKCLSLSGNDQANLSVILDNKIQERS